MKLIPQYLLITALTGVCSVAADPQWEIHTRTIAPLIKDKTIACGGVCVKKAAKEGIIDIFKHIEGGQDTGSVVKRVDGAEVVLNYRKNAPKGFAKPSDAQVDELAARYSHVPKQYPRQGCSTVLHNGNNQIDFSFTLNSDAYTFTSTPPACTGLQN
jgi:hypothetical protein